MEPAKKERRRDAREIPYIFHLGILVMAITAPAIAASTGNTQTMFDAPARNNTVASIGSISPPTGGSGSPRPHLSMIDINAAAVPDPSAFVVIKTPPLTA